MCCSWCGKQYSEHRNFHELERSDEGRYPFLDKTVQEFLAKEEVVHRRKKMFLAPFGTPFIGPDAPEYAQELLSKRAIKEYGYFDPGKVGTISNAHERII